MTKTRAALPFALAVLLTTAAGLGSEEPTGLKSKVTGILARFPAAGASDTNALAAEILRLGPGAVEEVCGRVLAPGAGDDSSARFALNGLGIYVTRSGAEKERLLFVRAVIDATSRAGDKEVKAFLISQLQLAGGKEAVKPLARYLGDARLAEPAAQALLAIGAPGTAGVMLKALDAAPAAARVTIIRALGELRSREAVRKLEALAASPDDKLRQTALYALANTGDSAAGPVLERSLVAASAYERSQAPVLYLLYARRLVESGKQPEGLAIARSLLKYYAAPPDSHVAAAALELLVSTLKDRALPDLLAGMDLPDRGLHGAALELALRIRGPEATARWVEKAAAAGVDVRAEIIAMLGRRNDASALPAVRQALQSPDRPVRLAAVPAAARLAGPAVLPDIFPLFRSEDAEDIAVAREVLLGFEAGLVVPEIVRIIEATPPAGRAALIGVLAAKGARDQVELVFSQAASSEPAVRRAAIAALTELAREDDQARLLELLIATADSEETVNLQNAIAAAAGRNPDPQQRADILLGLESGAPAAKRAAILRVLPRVGGEKALRAVIDETRNKDAQVQGAAVYALSRWPDFKAADELARIVQTAADKRYPLLALEGYVRLVNESAFASWKKIDLLKKALDLPKECADKVIILRGVAANRGPASLRMLADALNSRALKPTAAQLLLEMASEQAPEERWLSGHEAISILRRIEAQAGDPAEKEQAARTIADHLKQAGFVPLFNGRDLDGWKGLVADPPARAKMASEELQKAQAAADDRMRSHWSVADGLLIFDGKGESLCTVKDYGDFEMLVDWKIDKAGDSGIYLRGSPQVQIWDAAANPEGSGGLYNNQKGPRKPLEKADRPVGEWNTFRIIMIGERVTVYLNDRMVVDNTPLENYWERDKPIYTSGQLELQAHGNPLWFKNIYIREIPRDTALPALAESEKDEGFVPLFNGRDLAGWTGDTKGYVAENGAIVVHPELGGGNLYTEKEYADFVLCFEFKLTPAANNGVGIRAPLEGDAAYTGMEIQVLEDGSPVYWDLQPYQYHGSVYGVVPARRGVLRPVGEWNTEEITARGRKVTVIVNGVRVVDADLDEASAGGTIDHRDHPGLKRDLGHIGFLGHGSVVEFRNIRVKELK